MFLKLKSNGGHLLWIEEEQQYYRLNKKIKPESDTYYRCKIVECKARGKVNRENIFMRTNNKIHNHSGSQKNHKIYIFERDLKRKIAQDLTAPLVSVFKNLRRTKKYSGLCFKYEKFRQTMNRYRSSLLPKHPKNLYELHKLFENPNIMACFGAIEENKFYQGLVDVGKKGCALIFYDNELIERVKYQIESLYIDGTFAVVPKKISYQLLVIRAGIGEFSVR